MSSTSNSVPNVRQPVSCEPCRKRKIRCSRTRPPCDTCRRRKCEESCNYIGFGGTPGFNNGPSVANEELLARISNLEDMLRKHTASALPASAEMDNPMLSPPGETTQTYLQPSQLFSPQAAYSPLSQSSNVGSLTTSDTGNVRYEPRSSQWSAVLANTGISLATPGMDDTIGGSNEKESGFPFTDSPTSNLEDLIALLPPERQCEYLKNTYFTVFSPLFHILHDPSFHAQYSKFIDDPYSVSLSWLATLFIVLSLAVTALDEDDLILKDLARGPNPYSNVKVLSKRYRDASMKCLTRQGIFKGKHNVQSLQALVLLGYAMGHCQEHTWVLLGMTYNIAIALGCHIDPERLGLDPVQCEERRRCWAGLMMLYIIQNTVLGNLEPSSRISHDVKLPADVNDTDITLSGIVEPLHGPTQMSYLLCKFRLYNLTASICRTVFQTREPDRDDIRSLDNEICLAQESWDSRYMNDSTFDALPTHHAVHLHILQGYAHQLFLLLHRPFFAQSILSLGVPNESQIRCIASAEALLDIHKILCETKSFRPYMWYTHGLGSFHAFHAAVVLTVALWMPNYQLQYRKFKKILEDTVDRMERFQQRSKICNNAARILRVLTSIKCPSQRSQSGGNDEATPALSYSSSISPFESQRSDPTNQWLDQSASSYQLKFFEDCLQPEQWLGPSSINWTEWDNMMAQNDIAVT